jgi:mannose-6-phosphate isomerase
LSNATHETAAHAIARLLADDLRPLPLIGQLQPYAWGGLRFLKDLTGLGGRDDDPAAEWWIGAHPSAPARVTVAGHECGLDALIAAAPDLVLGPRVAQAFGSRLPFLLKVLDVRHMLSIQAHPTRAQARDGFARENARGLPRGAPTRNYHDDNHKPEAQVALTPFWMLSGFRTLAEIVQILEPREELSSLRRLIRELQTLAEAPTTPSLVLCRLYESVMRLPQQKVDQLLSPLIDRLAPAYDEGRLDRDSPDFWAVRAARLFRLPGGGYDRGILAIYLLNLVHLEPGQGTFLDAGILHAYLEGIVVEIMANSDNVIRGGLTPKHIDVEELLHILKFDPHAPARLSAHTHGQGERQYTTRTTEFGLSRLDLTEQEHVSRGAATGPEALIVIEGKAALQWPSGMQPLARGNAILIPAGLQYALRGNPHALLFRAFVPEEEEVGR